MVQQQKTPTLRFKEFDDEWNNFKIGDIFNVTRGQVLAVNQIKEIKDNDNCYPVYSSQTKNDGLLGYYDKYLFDTAITWTTDGANAGTVSFRKGKFFSTNVNGVLLSEDGFSNKMVAEALNNVAWRHVSRVGNPKLMNNVMSEIVLHLPSLPEQSAIGTLFQTIDELLSAYKDNLANYQAFKSSMLSKMFPKEGRTSPEIRLDGFDGEWEEKKLLEIAEFNPKSELPESFKYVDLESVIGVNLVSYRLENIDSAPSRAQRMASKGDIFFQTVRPYQKNNYFFDSDENDWVFSTGYTQLRPKITGQFLFVALQRNEFVNTVLLHCTGTSYPAINSKDLSRLKIYVPANQEEQQTIGEFFSNLDNLISNYQEKINQLETLKNKLLQDMFI